MSKIKIAAAAALLVMAIPVFAQDTTPAQTAPPSTAQMDQAKANQQAADALTDSHVHWTEKERAAIFYQAPYIRPNDMWEMDHMFREMDSNDQRVIFDAVTNAIQANAGDYYQRRDAEAAYWQNLYNNPSSMTTVTTTPNGTTAVTTTTTTTTPPVTVVTTPPPVVVNTTASGYSPTVNSDNVRQQSMIGGAMAVGTAMNTYAAWELLQRDLNAQDRTTFRRAWDKMTSGQQDALIDIARQSSYYYTARSNGYYYYYNP